MLAINHFWSGLTLFKYKTCQETSCVDKLISREQLREFDPRGDSSYIQTRANLSYAWKITKEHGNGRQILHVLHKEPTIFRAFYKSYIGVQHEIMGEKLL